MDSNLINIDDLVKQRLGGGEERERSGAWLRMQDMLEQEEKRKPFGMMFWRRTMITIGTLVLIALVSVGGYEVTNAFRGNDTIIASNDNDPAQGSSIASAPVTAGNSKTATADKEGARPAPAAKIAEKKIQQHAANTALATNSAVPARHNTVASAAPHKDVMPKATAATPTVINTASDHSVVTTNATANVVTKNTTTPSHHTATLASPSKAAVSNNPTASVSKANPGMDRAEDNATENTAITNAPMSAGLTTTDHIGATPSSPVASTPKANNKTATTKTAAPSSSVASAPKTNNKATVTKAVVASTNVAATHDAGQPQGIAPTTVATSKEAAHKTTTPATASATKHTLAADKAKHTATKAVNNNSEIGAEDASSMSVASNATNNKPATGSKATQTKQSPAAKNNGSKMSDLPLGSAGTSVATGAKQNGKQSIAQLSAINTKAVSKVPDAATLGAVTASAATSQKTAAPAKPEVTSKKTIRKIEMLQSATGTYPGRLQMHNDTISNDKITVETKHPAQEEIAAADETETEAVVNPNAGTPATKQGKEKKTTGIVKKGTASTKTTKPATHNKTTPAITAPTASSTGQPAAKTAPAVATATAQKGNQPAILSHIKPVMALAAMPPFAAPAPRMMNVPRMTPPNPAADEGNGLIADKKKGAYFMESLMKAFNDVKYKISGAQFTPGLTAGINGTFFGPNSCKGFQFGFTANFELDEQWSFMSELKYFNRLNNTYSLTVGYDKYDSNATMGTLTKQAKDVHYTFSTLHSFELPLSLRYAAGKFNFFGGANILYTLGVNVAADETDRFIGQNPTPVTAVGPNNKPSLQATDFAARFGIGYLFGLTYKIAPNMALDVRNVQTFWDNAKGSESKMVSDQLFKSPSLQFSLFYRFGNKSDEEK